MQALLNWMLGWFWEWNDGYGPEPFIREDHAAFTDDELLAEYAEMQQSFMENENE